MPSTTDEHQKMDSPHNNDSVINRSKEDEVHQNTPSIKSGLTMPPPSPVKETDDRSLDGSAKKLAALRLKRAAMRQANANLASTMMRPVEVGENANPKHAAETAPQSGHLGSVYPRMAQDQKAPTSKRFEEWLADGSSVNETEEDDPKLAVGTTSAPESGYLGSLFPRTEQGKEATASKRFEEVSNGIDANEKTKPKLTVETPETTLKPESAKNASTKTTQTAATPKPASASSAPIKTSQDAATPKRTLTTTISGDQPITPETSKTAPKPEDTSSALTKIEQDASTTKGALTMTISDEEAKTPRLSAYVKLHKDMMISRNTTTIDKDEINRLFHHGSHVANTLLTSHERHSDVPLVIRAWACLVLGCSDEDDCFERMEEALVLVRQSMEQGVMEKSEGEMMLRNCAYMMGLRGQVEGGGGWRGGNGSGNDASESENEDEGEGDGDGGQGSFELP